MNRTCPHRDCPTEDEFVQKLVTLMVFGILVAAAAAQTPASKETGITRPVVVKTVPEAGATAVDPALPEIQVTFSKDMMTDTMWSWVMESRDTFPKVVGKARYLDDRRTCVLPVELQPGKDYRIWINSANYDHFRDTGNQPAVSFLLQFRTEE
jgi:hypothetical protein